MSPRSIRARLLAWYDAHARDLPWRRTRDPYAIWVSEIMLQQTRVETVVPYYGRFLSRFPDVQALARAREDEVLALWSGLGYYRRARLLHAGAKVVAAAHGGRVPEGAEARAALPGIGRYTAGAIGSIAFDREEPIVDGNVARVLARFFAIETRLGERATEARLWHEAGQLVRGPRPGALNQALMELGATVCTPLSPRCEACPLRDACAARRRRITDRLPRARVKKAPRPVAMVAVIARPKGDPRVWLVRGEGSLFGGLFGVPSAEGDDPRAALQAHGLEARTFELLGEVTHVLTHRRLAVRVHEATTRPARASTHRRLAAPHDLPDVGIAALTRKILALAAR